MGLTGKNVEEKIWNFLIGKGGIDFLHVIHHLFFRQSYLIFRFPVGGSNHILHIPLFQKLDGSFESDKFAHLRHIDAVIVRITNLWRRRYNHDLLRTKTVENADDTLLQGSTTHNAIVDNHEIVDTGNQTSVRDVIYVGSQVIPTVSLGNECTELNIFDGNFFTADTAGKNDLQLFHIGMMPQCRNLPYFLFIQIVIQPLQHSVEGNFGRIRDKGKYSMVQVVINGFQNIRNQFFSQEFPFFIDIYIAATGEVNTFERAGVPLARPVDL